MKKQINQSFVLTAAAFFLGAATGQAGLLPNGDFEQPNQGTFSTYSGVIPNWTKNGSGGLFSTTYYGFGGTNPYFNSGAFANDGANMAYINSGTFSQILSMALTAGQTYALTGVIGNFNFNPPGWHGYAEIVVDGTTTFGNTSDIITPASGNTATWELDFTATTTGMASLNIIVGAPGGGTTVAYDNIALGAVPEPVNITLGMFGFLLIGGVATRRWMTWHKSRNGAQVSL